MNTQTFKLKLNLTKRQVGSFKVIQVSWKTESDEKHLTSKKFFFLTEEWRNGRK